MEVSFRGELVAQFNFKDKIILVTGAASGIGYAQAQAFLQAGAVVVGLDINQAGLIDLKNYDENFTYYVCSVTDEAELTKVVTDIIGRYGKIDVLLNTAGILDGYAKSLETSEELWDRVMDTNVKGMYLMTNKVLGYMLEKKAGVILNMTSIAGLISGGGGAAYTASKHAVVGYTKQLSYDYSRQGIRVNAIAPGAIQTPMNEADFLGDGANAKWVANETPAGRWAKAEEVANLTLFLASDLADYMHGTVIPVDGGWLNK